jgi:hypothetical protein
MPPLKQTLRSMSPEGYAATAELPTPPPAPAEPGRVLGANPFIRCPLPPFNATSDTLRQFNENGKVPARRVIPLPASVAASGNTTIVNNTTVTSTSGGSSGNVPVTVAAKTVSLSVPTLLPGDSFTAELVASAAAVLMLVGASDACEIRLYGDPVTQAVDVSRTTDTAPPFEVTQGLVSDVVLDTSPYQFNWQNRLFVNQDSPQTTNIYVTVLNPTSSAVTPVVTVTYLPLE